MPIPNFDHNSVLPPHLGSLGTVADISPYPCTTLELCQRFAISAERAAILRNFLSFRDRLRSNGLAGNAVQWLDGSFVEDIERLESRPPNDLDLVTIYWGYDDTFQRNLVASVPEFNDRVLSKRTLKLDHFPFDAGIEPWKTVMISKYWSQLFTHNRNRVWKGMLAILLDTPGDDAVAMNHLQTLTF